MDFICPHIRKNSLILADNSICMKQEDTLNFKKTIQYISYFKRYKHFHLFQKRVCLERNCFQII